MEWDREIDCLGLLCPLPVLRARKALAAMPAGAVLRLLASDEMAAIDLPHFCAGAGHAYLGASSVPGGMAHLLRCGAAAP
jgi:tRNA 2-thiouridine synthesizing protein A